MSTEPMFRGDLYFLSNFSDHKAFLDGREYPTAEHAYQAAKTLQLEHRRAFEAGTAGQAKRRGRSLVLRPDWELVKVSVMRGILATKFGADTQLAHRLVMTGSVTLMETNHWHDNVWGDCCCGATSCSEPGQNLLGQSLMWLRAYLAGWLQ